MPARYTGKSLDVLTLGVVSNIVQATYSTDGTKMLVVGGTTGIHDYSLSSKWDISSATYNGKYDPSLSYSGIHWKPDGLKFFLQVDSGLPVNLYEYTCSTAWQTSSGVSAGSVSPDIASDVTTPSSLVISPDGTKAYIGDLTSNTVEQFSMSTAWDVTTLSWSKSSPVISIGGPSDVVIRSDDGTTIWVSRSNTGEVAQYTLTTPWDVGAWTYVGLRDMNDVIFFYRTMNFDVGGNRILATGFPSSVRAHVYEYKT